MEKPTIEIIGTGELRHYKKDVPYSIPLGRFLSLPKTAFTAVNPDDMNIRVQKVQKEEADEEAVEINLPEPKPLGHTGKRQAKADENTDKPDDKPEVNTPT